ncbi:MAG TPA: hypothetical protein VIH70_06310 [Actinomycetota bacterium]
MENKKIIPLALFAIALLIFVIPERAFALQQVTVDVFNSTASNAREVEYESGTIKSWFILSSVTSTTSKLERVSATTDTLSLSKTLLLEPNHTTIPNTASGLTCSTSFCYVTLQQNAPFTATWQIQKYSTSTLTLVSYYNWTLSFGGGTKPRLGDATTLYGTEDCNGAPYYRLGFFALNDTTHLASFTPYGACGSSGLGTVVLHQSLANKAIERIGTTTDTVFNIWRTDTGVTKCSTANIGVQSGVLYSSTLSRWVITRSTSIVLVDDSCATTVISSCTSCPTFSSTWEVAENPSPGVHEIYISGATSGSTTTVIALDATSTATIGNMKFLFNVNNGGTAPNSFNSRLMDSGVGTGNTGHQVGFHAVNDFVIEQIEGAPAEEGDQQQSEFCAQPENVNLLTCRLETVPALAQVSASETFGNSTLHICQQIKLCDPNNDDIKTNGLGYLLVAIGLGVMTAIFWLASGGKLKDIPTFVWFIGTLCVLGAFTAFQFVDVTFFIVGILVIIALASAKIVQNLDLGGF